jgi:predicted transcriptional regulator
MTRPSSSSSSSSVHVLSSLLRFRQMTSSQVRRLHFPEGTQRGRIVRTQRCLARLVKLGQVEAITRPQAGRRGGAEYVYQLATSKTRVPDMHTLDIAELYVRLIESGAKVLTFQPEPYSYIDAGPVELKPDAYLRVQTSTGTYRYFLEVDRSTEYRAQLAAKMKRYVRALRHWDKEDGAFPQVVWIVPDSERLDFVQSVIRRQREADLFVCYRFSEAVEQLRA